MDPVQERNIILSALQAAAARLEATVNARLIPPEGLTFGYAIRGVRDAGGVAAVKGGIREGCGGHTAAGLCAFGADEAVATIILTVTKFDPSMRSAAILLYSDRTAGILEDDLFLDCVTLPAVPGNPGTSTMDWGIASCCEEDVPDVIIREGTCAKESRIILFGESPADVANNIIICSNRI